MRVNARQFELILEKVSETLRQQNVKPVDADVELRPTINGLRVDVIPHIWQDRERAGSHQGDEPTPKHLGYW